MGMAMDRYRLDKYGHVEWADSFSKFIRNAQSLGRLTAEDEDYLSMKIKEGKWAEETLATCENRREKRNLEALEEMGIRAREILVSYNAGLCMHVARKHQGMGVDKDDLAIVGLTSLWKATKTYDSKHDETGEHMSFWGYASYFVKGDIVKYLASNVSALSYPRAINKKLVSMRRAEGTLPLLLNRTPTAQELANEIDISPYELSLIRQIGSPAVSIEASREDDNAHSLYETLAEEIATESNPQAEESARKQVESLLTSLTPREREAYVKRHECNSTLSLEQIGAEMGGISRQRVQQLVKSAQSKLERAAGMAS